MKVIACCHVTPRSLVYRCQRFGETSFFYLQAHLGKMSQDIVKWKKYMGPVRTNKIKARNEIL